MYREIWAWRYAPEKMHRPFTEFEAWCWLIMRANYDTGVYGNEKIERGELTTSQDELSRAWRWSRSKVQRFLRSLDTPPENLGIQPEISVKSNNHMTKITICNYSIYQDDRSTDESTSEQPVINQWATSDQPMSTIKKNKKNKKKEEDTVPFSEIIEDLNTRLQQVGLSGKYRADSKATQQSIRARWGEGYRIPDFRRVHSIKVAEWAGTDMAKHLTPETLYRPGKFEKYVNQPDLGLDLDAPDSQYPDMTKRDADALRGVKTW